MVSAADPVLAEVWRGDHLECVHHGTLAITGPGGDLSLALGDPSAPFLPRSALKPMQAVAMLRHGLDLTGAQLALAGASHSGEPFHLDGVRAILADAGIPLTALATTPGLPLDAQAQAAWLAAGHGREPLAHNCSGKHAAMLRTCVRAGWTTDDYLDPAHPLQLACAEAIGDLTGEAAQGPVTDGCGAPAFAVSLTGVARAFGRIAGAGAGAERQLADAFREHPAYASGTRRDETVLHEEVRGLVCKVGAEGCFAVGLSDGTGIAVKIGDGHHRATVPVVVGALAALGLGTDRLAALDPEPVLGHGRRVGHVALSVAARSALRTLGA